MSWAEVLATLTSGGDLTLDEAHDAMASVLAGEATAAQIAAFAVGLRMKQATVDEVTGMVRAMLDVALPVPVDDPASVLDTCGTGGNDIRRRSTYSVSTIASLVAAGAGARVCKHGNRRASATCGSADTLEALGVAIELDGPAVARCVAESGMGFVFARIAHAAMRHAAPVRAELGVPTIFNYLGPLSNPARPGRQIVGVSDPTMAQTLLGVLAANGANRAMVVYGHDGLDELSLAAPSTALWLEDGGAVRTMTVEAAELGLAPAPIEAIAGGDPAANAALARRVLDGEPGPHRDVVVLNAAAALLVAGQAGDLAEGVAIAKRSIDDGAAATVLERLVEVSNAAAAAVSS